MNENGKSSRVAAVAVGVDGSAGAMAPLRRALVDALLRTNTDGN